MCVYEIASKEKKYGGQTASMEDIQGKFDALIVRYFVTKQANQTNEANMLTSKKR